MGVGRGRACAADCAGSLASRRTQIGDKRAALLSGLRGEGGESRGTGISEKSQKRQQYAECERFGWKRVWEGSQRGVWEKRGRDEPGRRHNVGGAGKGDQGSLEFFDVVL